MALRASNNDESLLGGRALALALARAGFQPRCASTLFFGSFL
jgi:hypothetical protein